MTYRSQLSALAILAAAFALSPVAIAQYRGSGPDETYFESFDDPLGADLTIDGPGGLASQPCPPGASQSAPDSVRPSRAGVDGPVCARDQANVAPPTGR